MEDYTQFLMEDVWTNVKCLDGSVFKNQIRTKFWFSAHAYWLEDLQNKHTLPLHYLDTSDQEIRKTPSLKIPHCSNLIRFRRRRFWHATQDCVAPYVDIILHRGRFWAKSAASGSVRWCCFRSVGRCWATWCGDDLVVFSSLPEGRLTGSSWHLCCHPCA